MPTIPYIPRLPRDPSFDRPTLPAELRLLGALSILIGVVQVGWFTIDLLQHVPMGALSRALSSSGSATPATAPPPGHFAPPKVPTPRFEVPPNLPIGVHVDPTPEEGPEAASAPPAPPAPPATATPTTPVTPTGVAPGGAPGAATSPATLVVRGAWLAMKAVGLALAVVLVAAGGMTLGQRRGGGRLHRVYALSRLALSLAIVAFLVAAAVFARPLAAGSSSSGNTQAMWNAFFLMLLGVAVSFAFSVVYPAAVLLVHRLPSVRA